MLLGQLRGVAREAQPAVGVAAAHGGEPVAARAQELEQTGEARRVDCRRRGAVQQPAEQRAQLAHRVGLPVDREEVEVAVVRDEGLDVGLLAHVRAWEREGVG